MAEKNAYTADAFTAGVKPGGLTNSTQIRLLLCYLIRCAAPLTREEIETALLGEQLVNYFEIGSALEDLEQRGLAECKEKVYTITEKGARVAAELENDLPRSVRESAIAAAVRAQVWNRKSAEYGAEIRETPQGYSICCSIRGIAPEDFSLQLLMPDQLTAELVKKRFILRGSDIYSLLLTKLTDPEPKPKP
ncbi:MAG: DUF4364 family protein [Faecalibacterium sp.]|jgi:DNA-binding PadR family transcriptional regulator|nr:DUF4364 family protein [Faecalibacterium sp.]